MTCAACGRAPAEEIPTDRSEASDFNGLNKSLGSNCFIAFQSVSEWLPKCAPKDDERRAPPPILQTQRRRQLSSHCASWRPGAVATTANHFKRKTSLIQFLAQFRIELVPIDRLIERDGSAFSLEIREDDRRPRTRGLARTVTGIRHDLASSDHIPSATSRCRLRSRSELIQYSAQIFAHFFFSIPAEVFSRRLSRLSVLMINVQLQSGIVHFDLGHPCHRSAFAKIVSHPDVAGQKSVRGRLSDASCRGDRPGLFSRSSIRRHRGDGGAEERRGKHDRKSGVHECTANAGVAKTHCRSVGSTARPVRNGTEGPDLVDRVTSAAATGRVF